jgi:hypothetical protein
MNPITIDSIGMFTPAAADAGGSVGAMVIGARRTDTLAHVSKDTLIGARTNLPHELVGMDRLVLLGSHVLWEAVGAELATQKIGLVVCAPTKATRC